MRGALRVRVASGRESILPSLVRVHLIDRDGVDRQHEIVSARWHGEHLLLALRGVDQREDAAALRGAAVSAPRSVFPPLQEDEFYWVDLIGCRVENRAGQVLGTVVDVDDHGAAPFVSVRAADGPEHLIPLVPAYLLGLDLQGRVLRVDWQTEWS